VEESVRVPDVDVAVQLLSDRLGRGDLVTVSGSARLERTVDALPAASVAVGGRA